MWLSSRMTSMFLHAGSRGRFPHQMKKAKLKVHISPFLLLPSICTQFELKIMLLWYNFIGILRSYQACVLLVHVRRSRWGPVLGPLGFYRWRDVFYVCVGTKASLAHARQICKPEEACASEVPWTLKVAGPPSAVWQFTLWLDESSPGSETEPHRYACSSIPARGDILPLVRP